MGNCVSWEHVPARIQEGDGQQRFSGRSVTWGKCTSKSSLIKNIKEFGFHPESFWEAERIVSEKWHDWVFILDLYVLDGLE